MKRRFDSRIALYLFLVLSLTITAACGNDDDVDDAVAGGEDVEDVNDDAYEAEPPEPITAEFPDDVRTEFSVLLGDSDNEEQGTEEAHQVNVDDLNELTIEAFEFEPGDGSDWHTHPSPVVIVISEGELTVTWADDCEPRTYEAGESFVDTGVEVHKAFNEQDEENTVAQAVWFGEPGTEFVDDDEAPGC